MMIRRCRNEKNTIDNDRALRFTDLENRGLIKGKKFARKVRT
jgi:hypothetical protein